MEDIDYPIGEKVMLLVIVLISIAFLYGTLDMGRVAATFPRFAAIITAVLGTLLLVRQYLPETVANAIAVKSVDHGSFKPDVVTDEVPESEPAKNRDEATNTEASGYSRMFGTYALTGVFLLFSYLFGMFLSAPVFIAVYGYWSDLSWKLIVLTSVIGLLLVYCLVEFLHIPLNRGLFELALFQLDVSAGNWVIST